jgi:hypothetical protein
MLKSGVKMNLNIEINTKALLISKNIKEMRLWEEANLPVTQSRLAFDLLICIAHSHYEQKDLTLKIIFNTLIYSERGIRYVLDYFIECGWCEMIPHENDKRFRCIKATQLLIDKFEEYISRFHRYNSDLN